MVQIPNMRGYNEEKIHRFRYRTRENTMVQIANLREYNEERMQWFRHPK